MKLDHATLLVIQNNLRNSTDILGINLFVPSLHLSFCNFSCMVRTEAPRHEAVRTSSVGS